MPVENPSATTVEAAPAPPPPKTSRAARAWAVAACAALVAVFAALSLIAAGGKSVTYDEPLHLVSGWAAAHHRDFLADPEDPPLFKYVAVAGTRADALPLDPSSPAWRAAGDTWSSQFDVCRATLFAPGVNADAVVRAAHVRMVALGALAAVLSAWWAWDLAGPVAAVAAAALFCLDPNFLGHAPLVKNDVPMTALTVGIAFAVWRAGRRAGWGNLAAAATLGAAAAVTKFSAPVVLATAVALLLVRAALPQPWDVLGRTLRTRAGRLAAAGGMTAGAALALLLGVWACYGFRYRPANDPAGPALDVAQWATMAQEKAYALRHGNGPTVPADSAAAPVPWPVRGAAWADAHHLVPQAFAVGFVKTYATTLQRGAYLLGQQGETGWAWYFPVAAAAKAPLATLAAALAALAVVATRPWARRAMQGWDGACLFIPAEVYAMLAVTSHANIGLRHVFPIYPFVFIGIGCAAAALWRRSPRATAWGLSMLGAGLALETALAFPNYIAFFNAAVGGSRGGLAVLSDSNLDWGQDLPLLARWQREHHVDPVYLCYFGQGEPSHYGVHYINAPGGQPFGIEAKAPQDGYLAISATHLQGNYVSADNYLLYTPLQTFTPEAVLGGTIYVYHLHHYDWRKVRPPK